MRKRTLLLAVVLLLVNHLALTPLPAAAQPFYMVDDLGTIDGMAPTVLGINDHGDVVGFVLVAGETRPVRFVDGSGLAYVSALETGDATVTAINNAGGMAGYRLVSGLQQAFRHEGGALSPIGAFAASSFAYAINDDGLVAGYFDAPPGLMPRAFRAWPGGQVDEPGTLGGAASVACGINRHGHLAGYSEDASGQMRLFRLTDDGAGMVDLGTLGGAHSMGCAINAAGQVAGQAMTAANVWRAVRSTTGAGLTNLDTFATSIFSVAEGINDAGDVVGWYFAAGGTRGFLYTDAHGALDLNTRIDASSGWTILSARTINNQGQVIGQGLKDGQARAFRLTPVVAADLEPPVIEAASATPGLLWPPDGRIVPVQVAVSVTDNLDASPQCRIGGVEASEPISTGDVALRDALTVELRAVRTGGGAGRVYRLLVTCADASGNESGAAVDVLVPHDMGKTGASGASGATGAPGASGARAAGRR